MRNIPTKAHSPKKTSSKKKEATEDHFLDSVLRPSSWRDYIGQDKIKENILMIIRAAQKRKENPDHLLLCGPTGLGKTTLAHLVSKETGSNLKIVTGPALEKAGDLAAVLSGLESRDILFIDECHRLRRHIEEILYPALESGKIHLMLGKGLGSRMITIDLPAFTLIGATTRADMLSAPLRSRFGAIFRLNYYSREEIEKIIKRSAVILGIEIDSPAITSIAQASRFTPRLANRLLKRSRDFAQVNNLDVISEAIVLKTLDLFDIDFLGLESFDRRILETIIKKFHNRAVGLNALAAALGEERGVIEEIYEPYLLQLGLLQRTPSGRVATESAYKHLGL